MVKHAIKYGQSDVKQGEIYYNEIELEILSIETGGGRMIRIGVIEDDSNMRKIVSQIIEKEIQGYEEVKQKTFESAEEFLQERVGYDIVISDIELPGINGIELGKRLSKEGKQTKLIYLTSYPEYA